MRVRRLVGSDVQANCRGLEPSEALASMSAPLRDRYLMTSGWLAVIVAQCKGWYPNVSEQSTVAPASIKASRTSVEPDQEASCIGWSLGQHYGPLRQFEHHALRGTLPWISADLLLRSEEAAAFLWYLPRSS